MSEKIIANVNLRPFTLNDFGGYLTLKNSLYPDHPLSLESFKHKEKTRSEKIQHKHWVWEKDNAILCSVNYTQWEEVFHPHKFVITIYVHTDQQGQGYGTFCYDFIIKELALLDPIKISSQVYELHTHSIRFLENRGFKNTIKERESSLDLTVYLLA